MTTDDLGRLRSLLTDSFDRVRGLAEDACTGLTPAAAAWRPDPDANSIAWLVWHSARQQDDQIAHLAGRQPVWTTGWADRFGLPFAPAANGYGQSSAEVGKVTAEAGLLAGYHQAVHEAALDYLSGLDGAELERVIDTHWDPPVTVAARLVSIIGDGLQHLGQAAYVRGMYQRLNR